jgi:hypothetical protein
MLSYSLNRTSPLDGSKILNDIDKLIKSISQHELSTHNLTISLQKITDYASDSLLPKIEYKAADCST